jgi:hypothetical protein
MSNTLLDLKTRIRLETNKDDIASGGESETALNTAIARAVEWYQDTQFWFNRGSGTVSTAASTATVTLPAAVRIPEKVAFTSSSYSPLLKVTSDAIEHLIDVGQPSLWAEEGDTIRLWPVPDAIYALTVYGVALKTAPSADGDITVWTNEAYDLIAGRTRFLLFRDLWRDTEGTQLAAQAEGEAFERLRRETRRRMGTPLRANGDEPWTALQTFNINRGY